MNQAFGRNSGVHGLDMLLRVYAGELFEGRAGRVISLQEMHEAGRYELILNGHETFRTFRVMWTRIMFEAIGMADVSCMQNAFGWLVMAVRIF